jgi:uncharacterized membrane protein (DUF485 family)
MSSDSSELRPPAQRAGRHASAVAPGWATGRVRPWAGAHRDLRLLRRACRWQRRVAALAALGYFAVFLALTVRVPSLMTRPAPGGLPFGLLLALVQLPVTWLAVVFYELTARRFVDPVARRVRRAGREGRSLP